MQPPETVCKQCMVQKSQHLNLTTACHPISTRGRRGTIFNVYHFNEGERRGTMFNVCASQTELR
jgi:hypothetical protein